MPLCYRAGPRALAFIRERGGLSPQDVRALVLPASGPKWLVAVGFDRALIDSGFFRDRDERLLLLGASAGAWRALAFASADPAKTHRALTETYCEQHFSRSAGARTVSNAYRKLLEEVFGDADLEHAISHRALALGLLAVRARLGTGSPARAAQALSLGVAGMLNALSPRTQRLFFDRILFRSQTHHDAHAMLAGLAGSHHDLTRDNARAVALASGTVPLYMRPVTEVTGAPTGAYIDGGLSDYHVNQTLDTGGDGVVLLFLHGPRIVPNWFDKHVPWRRPSAQQVRDLVLVHPDPKFVAALPGGAVPDRKDFLTFLDAPDERKARWREALSASERLGERWLADFASGAIASKLEAL